jgi:hypothetical protein
MSSWGKYYYKCQEELLPLQRDIAICHNCNAIVAIDVLPKSDDEVDYWTEDQLEAFVTERKSPARCLECRGHDHQKIPHVSRNKERDQRGLPYRTVIRHRDCGGRIYVDFSGHNFFMGDRLPTKYFDSEGIELEEASKKMR